MKRTLIALLCGALMAGAGACTQESSDTTGSSAGEVRGPRGKGAGRNPEMRAQRLQTRLGLSDEQTAKLEQAFQTSMSREEQMKVLEEILTPEQLTQYQDMMAGRGGRGRRPFRDPEAHATMLKESLGLSDEQTAKVKELFERRTDPASMQKAMEEILTPEQQTKYEEWKSQRGPGMGGGRAGPRGMRMRSPEKHAAWLQEELGLTDEVTAKVAAVFAEPKSPEATHEALKEILAPEEYAQFEEMIAEHGRWGGKQGSKAGFRAPKKHAAWLQAELGLSDDQTSKVETALSASKSREEMQKALEGILTPEQLAQHEQLMSERRHHFGRGMRGGKPGMHGRPGMGDGRGMRGGKRGVRGKADMGAEADSE